VVGGGFVAVADSAVAVGGRLVGATVGGEFVGVAASALGVGGTVVGIGVGGGVDVGMEAQAAMKATAKMSTII
jgi:hypothetical protein